MRNNGEIFFILLSIFINVSFANGQIRKSQSLEKIILNADTVLIVSHEMTGIIIDDKDGKNTRVELITNGKLNYRFINERKTLNDSLRKQLSRVLLLKNQSFKIRMNKCYMPQHAILIIKNHRLSYIDICFGCLKYETSDD